MPSDSLSGELHRIGALAAACVIAAAALGTFAVLRRLIPRPAPTPVPNTIAQPRSRIVIPPPSSAAAAASAGASSDPLAAAQAHTEKALKRSHQQEIQRSKRLAAAVGHGLAALTRRGTVSSSGRLHAARRVASTGTQRGGSSSSAPEQKSAPTHTTTTPTGGAPVGKP
jgi:hypothetical protein